MARDITPQVVGANAARFKIHPSEPADTGRLAEICLHHDRLHLRDLAAVKADRWHSPAFGILQASPLTCRTTRQVVSKHTVAWPSGASKNRWSIVSAYTIPILSVISIYSSLHIAQHGISIIINNKAYSNINSNNIHQRTSERSLQLYQSRTLLLHHRHCNPASTTSSTPLLHRQKSSSSATS